MFKVESEVGRLRQVILHRPGLAQDLGHEAAYYCFVINYQCVHIVNLRRGRLCKQSPSRHLTLICLLANHSVFILTLEKRVPEVFDSNA